MEKFCYMFLFFSLFKASIFLKKKKEQKWKLPFMQNNSGNITFGNRDEGKV